MNMKPLFLALAVASATVATTVGANAGVTLHFGPGGVTVGPQYNYDYDNRHYDNWGISRDEAINIAQDNGMRYVQNVRRRSHSYVVYGQTRHHSSITVTVDRNSGRVIGIDR